MYAHTSGGSKSGGHLTLHPCPKKNNYPNCQWKGEPTTPPSRAKSPPHRDPSEVSYGRGVGTIPSTCSASEEFEVGLCYPKCRSGYAGGATICATTCPGRFSDTGLHCLKPAAYERTPYLWVPFVDSQMVRCESSHGQGRCEWGGAVVYPKCTSGYSLFGWTTCSPTCPGNTIDIGISCQKGTYDRGVGSIPSSCGASKENQAGLCYAKCDADFVGVGPVCFREIDPATLAARARELDREFQKIRGSIVPYLIVVSKHLERLLKNVPNFASQTAKALERGDIAAIERLIQLDTLQRDIKIAIARSSRASQQNVSNSVGSDAEEPNQGVVLPEAIERALMDGDIPVAPMQTTDERRRAPSTDGVDSRSGEEDESGEERQVRQSLETSPSRAQPFRSITFAPLVADVSLIGGATFEQGLAWPLYRDGQYTYTGGAWSVGATAGVDVSVSAGLFVAEPQNLGGVAHGVTFAVAAGAGIASTVWLTYEGEFAGIQITPQAGVGIEVEYTRGVTRNVSFVKGSAGDAGDSRNDDEMSDAERDRLLDKLGAPSDLRGGPTGGGF